MCRLVPAPKEGPTFVLQHRAGLSPVTYCQYQAFIHKVVSRVGLNPSSFSSHSFRHGCTPPGLSGHMFQGNWLKFMGTGKVMHILNT